MHSYGRDFPHIGKVHIVLAAFAVGAYFLVVCGVRLAQGSFPGLAFLADVNVSPFVTLTIFGGLEFAFDRWAWRLLCGIPGVNVFDFSGKYSGKILASSKAEHPASITIKQTWSKIEVCFDSGSAQANSFSASVVRDRIRQGQVELIYNYFARGGKAENGGRFDHYGTAVLAREAEGARLQGDYYTEQDRDSFGTITMARESKSKASA
jgi:hypothetical protein